MQAALPLLSQLPRHSSSDVKNKWRDVAREVRQSGSVAITNHQTVEMVLVDAATYEQLAAAAEAQKAREQSVIDQLMAEFDQRLASLQSPGAAAKVAQVLARKGKLTRRPIAGSSF